MKADKTPREDARASPYKRTPTKSNPEPEVPRDAEIQQPEPYRLPFFGRHKGKTLEQLEREGNDWVIDWMKKNLKAKNLKAKNLAVKYLGLEQALEKWERERAPLQQPAAVVQRATPEETRPIAGPAVQPSTAIKSNSYGGLSGAATPIPITTPSKSPILPRLPVSSSPSIPSKATASQVFSGATTLAQPSSPTSQSTLSTATVQNDDDDYEYERELDPEDYIMPFGKHKGFDMGSVVPDSYLQWIVNTGRCGEDLLEKLSGFVEPTPTIPGVPSPDYKPPELDQAPPKFRDERTKFPLKIMDSDATQYFCLSGTQLEALRIHAVKPIEETKPTRAQYWLYHVYHLLSTLAPKTTADEALEQFLNNPYDCEIADSMAPGGDNYDYDGPAEFASYQDYKKFHSDAIAKKKANTQILPSHPTYKSPSMCDVPAQFQDWCTGQDLWITIGDTWKHFKLTSQQRRVLPTHGRGKKYWLYQVWDLAKLVKGQKTADAALKGFLEKNQEVEDDIIGSMFAPPPPMMW